MRDEHRIAIIGIGRRCPDATSPVRLWENVLSGRRPSRGVACGPSNSGGTPDADRMFRLARDVVSAALADAGYRDAVGLPRATTSVVLGSGGGPGTTGSCHTALAAGIADHFELGGGGFTVGGGGSPVLRPVIAAAAALLDHDVDVAVAGGITLCGDDADRFDDSQLTAQTDPYLDDHVVAGEPRFPVAMAIEAMVAAATAICGQQNGPALLTDVEFHEPIGVAAGAAETVRVAALVRDTEATDVVIRSGGIGFAPDHVRATVRRPRPNVPVSRADGPIALPQVPIDPVTELYGGTPSRGKRFQRLLAFRRDAANRVVAEVATTAPAPWFAPALPQDLVTADPGTRDAVLQVAQCLVPGATLVPHGVARLHLSARRDQDIEYVVVDARERHRDGELHHFDVDVLDPAGALVERWEGLTFRRAPTDLAPPPWVPALLGPHIERALRQVLGGHRTVIVEPDPVPSAPDTNPVDTTPRQADLAAGRAFGHPVRLRYGPDGEPVGLGASVAVDHGASMTLLATGRGRLGCAINVVEDRSTALADQEALLDRLTAETGEPAAVAGARVWTALRALRHTPASPPTLTFDRGHPTDGCRCGPATSRSPPG